VNLADQKEQIITEMVKKKKNHIYIYL
jgi:hypothetical protein